MQHCKRRRPQALEAVIAIEISDDRHDAAAAQLRYLVAPTREPVQPHLAAQKIGGAQRDVATAN
jgi:hypothetical protein